MQDGHGGWEVGEDSQSSQQKASLQAGFIGFFTFLHHLDFQILFILKMRKAAELYSNTAALVPGVQEHVPKSSNGAASSICLSLLCLPPQTKGHLQCWDLKKNVSLYLPYINFFQ